MATIEQNRKLMVENMKKVKSQLSEADKTVPAKKELFKKGVHVVANKNTNIQGLNGEVTDVKSGGVEVVWDAFDGRKMLIGWKSALRDLDIYVDENIKKKK